MPHALNREIQHANDDGYGGHGEVVGGEHVMGDSPITSFFITTIQFLATPTHGLDDY